MRPISLPAPPVGFAGAVRAFLAVVMLLGLAVYAVRAGDAAAAIVVAVLIGGVLVVDAAEQRAGEQKRCAELVADTGQNLRRHGWLIRAAGCDDAGVALTLGRPPTRFLPVDGDRKFPVYEKPPEPAAAPKKVQTVPEPGMPDGPPQEFVLRREVSRPIEKRILRGKVRAAVAEHAADVRARDEVRKAGRGDAG